MRRTFTSNIKRPKLEQLHCSICKGYLSCAPIRLLPDGSNLCGRCNPSDNDASVYRVPALETIFSDATFPCTFRQHGCTARLLFGHTGEHEAECKYKPVTCASLPYTTCSWEGSVMKIPEHFAKHHPDLVKENAEFKLQINENQQGILMVVKNNCTFIIKYSYDADMSSFKYNVGCFAFDKEEDFSKIKLTNILLPDYTISLMGPKCVHYKHSFFVADNVTVLALKNVLEILNNPTSIAVALMLPNFNIKNRLGFVVDYDLLESNKCGKCRYYLIPPIYCYDLSKGSMNFK